MTKTLLVRLPNWLGDLIMALPALDYLEQAGYQLTLLGKPWVQELLSARQWQHLDVTGANVQAQLMQHPAQECVLFTNSLSSALMSIKAKKNSYGFRGDWRRVLLHQSFKKIKNVHETVQFLSLAQAYVAYKNNKKVYFSEFNLQKPGQISLPLILGQEKFNALKNNYLVICPFAMGKGDNKQSKVWPYWQEFVVELVKKVQVVCCPGPIGQEQLEAKKLESLGVEVIKNTTLTTYAQIMQHATMVIGNDSGPMHLAAAVNKKTYTLFGATRKQRTAPIGTKCLGEYLDWPSINDVMANVVASII